MSTSKDVIIATNTLYNLENHIDQVRSKLSKQTIKSAKETGYDVIIIDSGSPQELLDEYKHLGAVVISGGFQGLGKMGKGRQEAFRKAFETGKEVVVWTEPEKVDLIKSVQLLSKPIFNKEADIVIPRRKSLQSYPVVQQYSEPFMNLYIEKLTGYNLDTVFGPRVISRDSLKYFIDYDGRYGDKWDRLFIPIFSAIKDGKTVSSVEIDYTHPKEQTAIEDSFAFYKKRLEQINNILPAVEEFWNEE